MADRRDDVIGLGKADVVEEPTTHRHNSRYHASLMGWSDKQSHILTGGGVSSELYQAPRFPFSAEELPHFHKSRGTTHEAFAAWRRQGTDLGTAIAGAWRRPLFVGGWTHSDDVSHDGETTFNLQTPSLFLDMRVPKAGSALLGHHRGFETMTDAFDQHVYMERWQRLPAGGGPFLALRRRPAASSPRKSDALLVVCGDHFGLIVDRRPPDVLLGKEKGGDSRVGGVVGVVDAAIARGDRRQAVEFMSLEASHGRVSGATGYLPWTVDCSLHPWLQGRRPFCGTVLTVAPDRLSITLAVSREVEKGRQFRGQDGDNNSVWTGVPLDGVWDVVESTLSHETGDSGAQPTLYALFGGSGASVEKGDRGNKQGGAEDCRRKERSMGKAKL